MKTKMLKVGIIVLFVCCCFGIVKVFDMYIKNNKDNNSMKKELVPDENVITKENTTVQDSSIIYENNNLNLTGNDSKDSMIIQRVTENGKYLIIISISSQSGLSKEESYNISSDKDTVRVAIGQLNQQDRDSVVIEITNGTSNYGSSNFYVFHVEQKGEELSIMDDLTVLDRDSQEEAIENEIYKDSILEMPTGFTITMTEENGIITYIDRIKKNAIQINEYDSSTKSNLVHYIYWTGDSWVLLEN